MHPGGAGNRHTEVRSTRLVHASGAAGVITGAGTGIIGRGGIRGGRGTIQIRVRRVSWMHGRSDWMLLLCRGDQATVTAGTRRGTDERGDDGGETIASGCSQWRRLCGTNGRHLDAVAR